MSAFVVDDACMTNVVRAICYASKWSALTEMFDGQPTRHADSATKIGRRLFALNIEAVMQRYPDCRAQPNDLPGPCDDKGNSIAHEIAAAFTCEVPAAESVTVDELCACVKSMHCLQYQCSEGNVPETRLYKALNRAIGRVCEHIVSNLPAYERAPWG